MSGNALSEGDYPVGVAFPHPQISDMFFHLVYLPTPRQQMAYEGYVELPPAQRLRELSRHTLDRLLASSGR